MHLSFLTFPGVYAMLGKVGLLIAALEAVFFLFGHLVFRHSARLTTFGYFCAASQARNSRLLPEKLDITIPIPPLFFDYHAYMQIIMFFQVFFTTGYGFFIAFSFRDCSAYGTIYFIYCIFDYFFEFAYMAIRSKQRVS